jgi:AraC-like DNA-binding protein
MQNKYHQTTEATSFSALTLEGAWEVNADREYRVRREPSGRSLLVLVRTLSGAGRLIDDANRAVTLDSGTLFCIEESRVRFYETVEPDWQFWWFLVLPPSATLPLPLHRVMRSPIRADEEAQMREITTLIKHQRYLQRALGMARFTSLVLQWLAGWRGAWRRGVYDERIEALVVKLNDDPGADWSVARMARFCHVGERRFRDVFRGVTGSSPKRFLDRIRLDQGRELLRMGLCNVSEAAERLGYSSPFHFSRAYSRRFGEPPSAAAGWIGR